MNWFSYWFLLFFSIFYFDKIFILCTWSSPPSILSFFFFCDQVVLLVIIIGDSGVGKSNILRRWTDNTFSATGTITVNCEYQSKDFMVHGKVVRVVVWDTAGQERYRSVTRQYYKGANACLAVYSVTDALSFKNLGQWLMELEEVNEEVDIVLVANKIDITERKVSVEEGREWAKRYEFDLFETSAKDGTNCWKAVQFVLQKCYEKYSEKSEEKTVLIDLSSITGLLDEDSGSVDSDDDGDNCGC
eukprot:TRINITY_DN3705_c0_g1_i22.p1 TRINITY_DN3705_c0_g1~~TRINITY_DN3705_c0_g1_i22.p1  ORF type:complete len:245 (+),score=55.09 TRINITY_DN3705_c0_g1_i22:608-1342(+)